MLCSHRQDIAQGRLIDEIEPNHDHVPQAVSHSSAEHFVARVGRELLGDSDEADLSAVP